MMRTSLPRLCGNISLILICVVLGACGSMQKSSSSSAGEQSAAPISEASQPGDKSSAAKAASSASSDAGSSAASKPAGNSDVTGKPIVADAAADNSEASQLKRQLDEQDAQINRLRNDQQAEEARLDAEQRMQEQQQSAAGAGSQGKPAANDEAAVFPAGDNSASPAGTAAATAAAAAAADKSSAIAPAATDRSVYFAYNEAIVAEKYDDMLLANAAYLRAHPNFTAEVQGNCDDRGSREYNLALGARRAEAVKRALELAGANGSRISAISYGAEKPVASGKDEDSYRKNRRVDILY